MPNQTHLSGRIRGKGESGGFDRSHGEPDGVIARLAEQQHGVVCRRQLRDLGLSDAWIEGRCRRGSLYSLHRGVYAVGHRVLSIESRWIAAVLASGSGAVLSHRPAGQLWRILPRFPVTPEVIRPTNFKPRPDLVAHHLVLPADEIEEVRGIPVTSAARTLFDLAAVLKPRQMERAWNEAEVRRLTSVVSVPQLLERYPGRPGAPALRALLASDEPGGVTHRGLEERFLTVLDAHGLPRPHLNADLVVAGRQFEIDCLWRPQRVAVELDSRAVHATDRAFQRDRSRDRILQAAGWRTARVTWRHLDEEEAAIVADLRRLLLFDRG